MGVVYRAFDSALGHEVALKTLDVFAPSDVRTLKQEFRALIGITHPNLVNLHDLVVSRDLCFFTMELLEGRDLVAHVREGLGPGEPLGPEALDRLRAALPQLMAGLRALHTAGRLHRDIKPSNVIVTPSGRVVYLDFGLALPIRQRLRDSNPKPMAGTLAYMSPEQIEGQTLTPASDWYSLGVAVYEALTGKLPFPRSGLAAVLERLEEAPPAPSTVVGTVPSDLEALVMGLMQPRPGDRVIPVTDSAASSDSHPFVGREDELEALGGWLGERPGRPNVVHVHGPTGIGKSELVARILAQLDGQGEFLTFEGRCHPREAVPFKALDAVVDQMAAHLTENGALPQDAVPEPLRRAVARAFPILRTPLGVDDMGRHDAQDVGDPAELRRRVADGLRLILAALARGATPVLWIDDLQWGDQDSVALLRRIVDGDDAPGFHLVFSYRTEALETSDLLAELPAELGASATLCVGRLSHEAALELASFFLGPEPTNGNEVVAEAQGSPLYLCELARNRELEDGPRGPTSVADLMAVRIEHISPSARSVLACISLAGRPVRRDVALKAAGVGADANTLLDDLNQRFLVTTRRRAQTLVVEPSHDRIRETMLGELDAQGIRRLHGALAAALEPTPDVDPEALAEHHLGAGDTLRAGEGFRRAATIAAEALAFARAADLFGRALELLADDRTRQPWKIEAQRARALAGLGRSGDAARAYEGAAARLEQAAPGDEELLELRRQAAEQYLRGGHLDEGATALQGVLQEVGETLPSRSGAALASVLWQRSQLWMRGMNYELYREWDTEALRRFDACWTAGLGLSLVDHVRSAHFQCRCVLVALRAGEPRRIARGLATAGSFLAVEGGASRRRRSDKALKAARALAEKVDAPYELALVSLSEGAASYFGARFMESLELCRDAEQVLRDRCVAVAWELTNCHLFTGASLAYMGRFDELVDRVPQMLEDAKDRGDVLARVSLGSGPMNMVWLARDEPQKAVAHLESETWGDQGMHIQFYLDVLARAHALLYQGETGEALATVERAWPRLKRTFILELQSIRTELWCLRSRCALAHLAGGAADPDAKLRRRVASDARRIRRERIAWSEPLADGLEAGIRALAGDRPGAAGILERAARGFAGLQMGFHVQAAARARAVLDGDDAAREQAEQWMRAHGIVRPDRLCPVVLPAVAG